MKIYLDVSCLNRPFDDQTQGRIRIESEAVTIIMDGIDAGQWSIRVANPADWLKEQDDATNSG